MRRWYGVGEVPHYYGDIVRQLFLGGAALLLFAAPFYADSITSELPYEIAAGLAVVCLAALTNPWKRWVITSDAITAGIIAVVYEWWALTGYDTITPIAFVLRQATAIIFLFAFYFSVKTVRAMALHQVGRREERDEFSDASDASEIEKEETPREEEVMEDGLGEPAAEEDDKGGD